MDSVGMCAFLASSITPSSNVALASSGSELSLQNTRQLIRRYLFGLHAKTKRSLAEEAECGDEISVVSWIKDGTDPDELDAYGYTPLLNAAAIGRCCAIDKLLKNGADINRKGPYGFTALHAAAQNGHREAVQMLLEHGADIDAQNDDQDTAMHLAITTQQIDIVYLLLRKGCNVYLKGFNGKDCIETAIENNMKELGKYIEGYATCMNAHKKCKDCKH